MSLKIFGGRKMEIHNNKTEFNGNWLSRCLSGGDAIELDGK